MTSIKLVDTEDRFIHVRFRDPDEFEAIRTPAWARRVSGAISKNSEVRMGKVKGTDEWLVESVLLKKNIGEEKAKEQARKILEKLESS